MDVMEKPVCTLTREDINSLTTEYDLNQIRLRIHNHMLDIDTLYVLAGKKLLARYAHIPDPGQSDINAQSFVRALDKAGISEEQLKNLIASLAEGK